MEQLRFLGVGSAFNAALGTNSAFFYHDGNLYLLDCGETVFERALHANLFDGARDITVLITHLHSDHVGSLGTLLGYCYFILKKPATVVCPNPQLVELMRLMDIAPHQYRLLSSLDEGGVRAVPVSAIPTLPPLTSTIGSTTPSSTPMQTSPKTMSVFCWLLPLTLKCPQSWITLKFFSTGWSSAARPPTN